MNLIAFLNKHRDMRNLYVKIDKNCDMFNIKDHFRITVSLLRYTIIISEENA